VIACRRQRVQSFPANAVATAPKTDRIPAPAGGVRLDGAMSPTSQINRRLALAIRDCRFRQRRSGSPKDKGITLSLCCAFTAARGLESGWWLKANVRPSQPSKCTVAIYDQQNPGAEATPLRAQRQGAGRDSRRWRQ